jgi:hypothetical protein
MQGVADFERWRPEQTRLGRLVGHEVEAGRASGCASSAQIASQSLALAPRLLEALSANERSGDVAGMLMDIARDLARRLFWAALRFERAYIAVKLTGAIQKRLALVHGAARPEPLSARAVVDVAGRIISKVAARRCRRPGSMVVHRNVARCPSSRTREIHPVQAQACRTCQAEEVRRV